MIEYITPALELRLKQLGVRKEYIAPAVGLLIRCWAGRNCLGAHPYLQLCSGDPLCEYIQNIIRYKDREGALRALAWYVKCTGKGLAKKIEVAGRIVAYDYTEEFLKKHPPPPIPCERNI